MMNLLGTIVIFFVVILSMVFLTVIALVLFVVRCLGFKRSMDHLIYKLAQAWALIILAASGCKLTVTGREHIPRTGGFCLVANHNSIFDIVLLLATVGRPFGFIAKKELKVVPLINFWILLLGGLFIDRKNIRKAIGTINEGIRRIKAGAGMIIFPEGTRGKGKGMLPFKPGSLKLATKAGAPMVPLAITGSYDVFEKTYRFHPGPVSVNFAPPLAAADIPVEDKGTVADQVYAVIDGMLKKAEGSASLGARS
ncbi:MAG: 1-acyl-sn-glycerol-3-phosphate acyltransferase [Treponema sp.]|jgi:1-acyl-sn-glycerol-3-phosphate acyltransferase|nr:1-acyl-sn-glycerol-3-phosphate acyltransferase [Treponema sp.]